MRAEQAGDNILSRRRGVRLGELPSSCHTCMTRQLGKC